MKFEASLIEIDDSADGGQTVFVCGAAVLPTINSLTFFAPGLRRTRK